jgi:hypothetical protein
VTLVPVSSHGVDGISGPIKTGSNFYYAPAANANTQTYALGSLVAYAAWFPSGVTLNRICCEVTSAGGAGNTARLGIYRDAGGYPGALLLDAGTVATDTGTNREITIAQQISTSGLYWLAYVSQGGTAATVRGVTFSASAFMYCYFTTTPPPNTVQGGYIVTGVAGALPDPFGTPPLTVNGDAPRVYVRVA